MEFKGAFYDLFKLYHDVNVSEMISSFDIPKTLSTGLVEEVEYLSPSVHVVDTLDYEPESLSKYLSSTSKSSISENKKFAVIRGSAHDVYFVMSNIRDDVSKDPLKTMKKYDVICEQYNLPSMIPHLKIR